MHACMQREQSPPVTGMAGPCLLTCHAGAILAKMVKPVKVKPGAGSLSSPLHGSPQSPGCPVPVFSLIKLWNTTAHKPIHR